jgi:hypothetical protein
LFLLWCEFKWHGILLVKCLGEVEVVTIDNDCFGLLAASWFDAGVLGWDAAHGYGAVAKLVGRCSGKALGFKDGTGSAVGALIGGEAHCVCQAPNACVRLELLYLEDATRLRVGGLQMVLPMVDLGDSGFAVGAYGVGAIMELGGKDATNGFEVGDGSLDTSALEWAFDADRAVGE